MKASSWNWITPRPAGLSKYSSRWLRAMAIAIPWITVLILLVMLHFISNTMTVAKGVMFELPEGDQLDGSTSQLVALVMPSDRETLVFFDDARYSLDDRVSMDTLREHLESRASKLEESTLVVIADSRVAGGKLSRLASVAKKGRVKRLLLAHKEPEAKSE